jgi:hypothetical protein
MIQMGLASVDAHAHPQRSQLIPEGSEQTALSLNSGCQRLGSGGKSRLELIANDLENGPSLGGDGALQHRVVHF